MYTKQTNKQTNITSSDDEDSIQQLTRSGARSLMGKGWSGWAGQTMGWDWRTATMQFSIMKPNLDAKDRSIPGPCIFLRGTATDRETNRQKTNKQTNKRTKEA